MGFISTVPLKTLVKSVEITGEIGGEGAVAQVADNSDKNAGFEFPMWFFLAALAVLLLAGATVAKRGEWQQDALSLENSKSVQGFCALAIILHHMSQGISSSGGNIGALSVLVDAGVLFVGIFFFFSGFGLIKSLRSKNDYLKGFLKKRLPSVLVPFYVCIFVFIAVALLLGEKFHTFELLGYISGWLLINSHMWYIVEIAVLYVAFFLIFRFIKNEKLAFTAMGVFIALLVVGSLLLGHGYHWFQGEWWFNSTMLFFIGMLVARLEPVLSRFAKKFYAILLPLSAAAFGIMFALKLRTLNNYSYYDCTKSSFITLGIQLPAIILFVLTVLLIMLKVKFSNRALKFVGTIALELYLIHNLFIAYLRSPQVITVKSDSLYILLVIVSALILAAIIHGFDKNIIGIITGKLHPTLREQGDSKLHSIDFMRLAAVFLVVAIHIPFENAKAAGMMIAFGKTAVPFFLVVCGYFLYRTDDAEFMARLKKQALRIFILAAAANILYLLWAMISSDKAVGIFLTENFTAKNILNLLLWNMSPFGDHLWYLGSLFYAILILMLLCKTKLFRYAVFAAPLLLAGYITLSYTLPAENYFMYRNAVLCTLPYLMFGCLIRRYGDKLTKPNVWWYIGVGAALCVMNVIEYGLHGGDVSVPYFSAELLVYVIVLIALKLPSLASGTLAERLGSKCTLFVYIAHIAVSDVILMFAGNNAPRFFIKLAPIVVFTATLLLAVVWNFLKSLLPKNSKSKASE